MGIPRKRTPTPVDPATSGSIKGVVLFKGTPPAEEPLEKGGDAACAQQTSALEEQRRS